MASSSIPLSEGVSSRCTITKTRNADGTESLVISIDSDPSSTITIPAPTSTPASETTTAREGLPNERKSEKHEEDDEQSYSSSSTISSSSSSSSASSLGLFGGWARVFFQRRHGKVAQRLMPNNSTTLARHSYLYVQVDPDTMLMYIRSDGPNDARLLIDPPIDLTLFYAQRVPGSESSAALFLKHDERRFRRYIFRLEFWNSIINNNDDDDATNADGSLETSPWNHFFQSSHILQQRYPPKTTTKKSSKKKHGRHGTSATRRFFRKSNNNNHHHNNNNNNNHYHQQQNNNNNNKNHARRTNTDTPLLTTQKERNAFKLLLSSQRQILASSNDTVHRFIHLVNSNYSTEEIHSFPSRVWGPGFEDAEKKGVHNHNESDDHYGDDDDDDSSSSDSSSSSSEDEDGNDSTYREMEQDESSTLSRVHETIEQSFERMFYGVKK